MHATLNAYFTKIVSQQQCGFRYIHSASLAIANMYENFLKHPDR